MTIAGSTAGHSPPLCVVVGASGILAPLGALLHNDGYRTIGISRGSRIGAGDWDVRVALDATDVDEVVGWLTGLRERPDLLIGYDPALSDATWPLLAAAASRTIVVATSRWVTVDPGQTPWSAIPDPVVLQLGWLDAPAGPRWHVATEISVEVQRLVTDPAVRFSRLGHVNPPSQLPRGNS
jgi:hypothetical protein